MRLDCIFRLVTLKHFHVDQSLEGSKMMYIDQNLESDCFNFLFFEQAIPMN